MTPREELTERLVADYRQELAALTDAELFHQADMMAKFQAMSDTQWCELMKRYKESMGRRN